MGSVLDRLEEREAQARVLAGRLREEVEQAAGALAAAGDSLSRLVIARETVAEVLGLEADEDAEVDGTPGAAVRGVGRDVALYERITGIFTEAGRRCGRGRCARRSGCLRRRGLSRRCVRSWRGWWPTGCW